MNVSILPIAFGAILLFTPKLAWAGIALLAIGAVTYAISRREPNITASQAFAQSPYMQDYPMWPQRRRGAPGVAWNLKDQYREGVDQIKSGVTGETTKGPHIKDGMFNLPVPMENEVGDLVDLNYKVPTKAKGFTQGKDKGGNPWLPGF